MKALLRKRTNIYHIILLIFILTWPLFSPVYSQNLTEEAGRNCFSILDEGNRYVNDLLASLRNENEAFNLPLGVKKTVGGSSYTLAISNIKLGERFGEITMFLKIENLYKSRELIFGAAGVKISYTGDLIGDVKFSLLSNIPIPLGNMGEVILKGSMNTQTGASSSNTYLSVDCNGDFLELSIDGELVLNENTFQLAGQSGGAVRASFRTTIFSLTDLLLQLSVPKFEIRGIPGFEFALSNVVLDLSDTRNADGFIAAGDYFNKYFTLPDKNLWKGVYAQNVSVTFPSMFNKKGSGEKSTLAAKNFIIDENGITGDIIGNNVLPFALGDASGCSFSVTDFMLGLEANNIYKFGFAGEIDIPMTENSKPLRYEAFISKGEYLFNVSLGQKIEFNLFGAGELKLMPTSFMQVGVSNGKFVPKVILDGEMALNTGGLSIGQLAFKKLSLSTQSPVFSVESVVCSGDISLHNFPISIHNFNFSSQNDIASLGFDLKINLMEGKISAVSSLKMRSEYINRKWNYKGLDIGAFVLNNVSMPGFSLSGEVFLAENDPVYGNCFGGNIKATFGALSDALTVQVKAIFGQKDFRYWFVEGDAHFSHGVQVGVVTINGFTGGAYYRMSPTSGTGVYTPNINSSLGVKAGVSFHIANKNAVAGNALFEMNFLSSGGIGSIMFYGNAKFMDSESLVGDKYKQYYSAAKRKVSDFGSSFTAGLPGNLNGSEMALRVVPDIDLSGAITAALSIRYEFTSRTFDANFKVTVNVLNILRGAGNNDEAGWVDLHCSPSSWYIHVGKPSNPIGLKMGLGPLSLETESYFMLGDRLEKPIIDQKLMSILKISPEQADYMRLSQTASLGNGIAFGSRFSFDTGNISFLILYARFMAGAGFDVMLSDMSAYRCAGSNSLIGINGWYASGQCYAYLSGELGVRIKILAIRKNITIIKGAAGALLQAKLPNPTWVGGYMAVDLNVLGIIKANMKMKFSFGDECELVRADGEYTPLDFPVIADTNPVDRERDVDVFLSPQVTFNLNPDEAFEAQDDDGNTRTYRIRITDYYITDNKGQRINGNIKRSKMAATVESFEILPPFVDLKLTISVGFEENVSGSWRLVSQNGKPANESRTVQFTTGGAPNYVPLSNIEYCYPVISQKNFLKGESQDGYVQLKKGQSYLFPPNFDYRTAFAAGGNDRETKFRYVESEKRINYSFPALDNRRDYLVNFVAYATGSSQKGTSQYTQSATITDGNESFTIDYMQQAAQKIIQDGSMKVLEYNFRTSGYNLLSDKLSAFTLNRGVRIPHSDMRMLYFEIGAHEMFDEIELNGSIYSNGKPLIEAEAVLDDPYYTVDIAPLTYNLLSVSGMTIQTRDPNIVGAPPVRGFSVLDGYFTGLLGATRAFPIEYQLTYYYFYDFQELRTKAANLVINGTQNPSLTRLMNSQFPLIKPGSYKTQIKYILPGGKSGSTKQLNYTY